MKYRGIICPQEAAGKNIRLRHPNIKNAMSVNSGIVIRFLKSLYAIHTAAQQQGVKYNRVLKSVINMSRSGQMERPVSSAV